MMYAAATATTTTAEPGRAIKPRTSRVRAFVFVLALIIAGAGLLGIGSPSSAEPVGRYGRAPALGTATPTCGTDWQIVPSPNQGTEDNSLGSVAAVSPNDVWAVGYYRDVVWKTLTEHWDGTSWSTVPSPSQGNDYNELRSVAAVSPNDVWAVGYFSGEYPEPTLSTLTEHWDGTSWTTVPSPNQDAASSFRSVAAISSTDVWAVGYSGHGLIIQALVEHWNGALWEVVPVPQPSTTSADLFSVAAVSTNDVWAVGSYWESPVIRPLVLHWNGTQWSIVPSPTQGGLSELHSVAALSASDVWAVGYYYIDPYNAIRRTLVLHWDGTSWSIVPSPNQGDDYNELLSVAAISSADIWAVGHYRDGLVYRTLVEHWDGTQWSIVPSPNVGTGSNDLLSVAVASPYDVWALGYYHNGSIYQTLTVRYNPCPPSPTPTVTGTPPTNTPTRSSTSTATPPPPTLTVPPHTATAAPTETRVPSTPCAISFSDVQPGDTFYPYVRCLACRGIVSGYSDGTFHPNDNVTRGQLSKIVANAAGLNEPVEGQTFSDVPPGYTFYEYIERLARRGFISGYSDGTFRPANPATRGQICKIVANTAGYNEPVSGQRFTDVPPTHTFYEYIERMASRDIVNGYSDGTFRPQNNATRGQVSKIVANTFFPNCETPNRIE